MIARPTAPVTNATEAPKEYFSSGSTMLDLALGGGWARRRIINVVGDKSVGKTLLAIEALANFENISSTDHMRYVEPESAFTVDYARSIGFPMNLEPDNDINVVEDFATDLQAFTEKNGNRPGLYAVDSLDAFSDESEMKDEGYGDHGYGAKKPKILSEMFRRLTRPMAEADVTLMIISQLRDKLNVTFGETQMRSGGRALDYYASQIVWLYRVSTIERTVLGDKRAIGVNTRAKIKKNKVGAPFREAEFPILFSYGIDDQTSMLDWLKKTKKDSELSQVCGMTVDQARKAVDDARHRRDRDGVDQITNQLKLVCCDIWKAIEDRLMPPMGKYR